MDEIKELNSWITDKDNEIKMLHEVIAQYKATITYEHTRFMEEQGKRSDLEREVETLQEDIKTMSKCEELNLDLQKKMNEENEKLQEEVDEIKIENEWWGNIKDNLVGEKYELEKEIKKLKKDAGIIVWDCNHCGKGVIRDSEDHDNSMCNEDGSKWWCSSCFHDGKCPNLNDDSSDFDDELVSVDCDVCGCHHSEYDRCGTNCN